MGDTEATDSLANDDLSGFDIEGGWADIEGDINSLVKLVVGAMADDDQTTVIYLEVEADDANGFLIQDGPLLRV